MSDTVEIKREDFDKLIEALKRATHKDYEDCGADICELITKALKGVKDAYSEKG